MKKGARQSSNVEHGKPLNPIEKNLAQANEMFGTNYGAEKPGYTGVAKRQLEDQRAFKRGRDMGMGPDKLDKALENIRKAEPKGPRFPKRDRNPFAKARSK